MTGLFKILLGAIGGYGLAQHQQQRRSDGKVCFQTASEEQISSLPDQIADQAEEIIQRGGQVLLGRIRDAAYIAFQDEIGNVINLEPYAEYYGGTPEAEEDVIDARLDPEEEV